MKRNSSQQNRTTLTQHPTMFKKPKKKPAALRSTKNDDTTTNNLTLSSSKKRRRHSDDESSSSSDDEKNATQDLLQQLRDERSNNINSSSKKINTSSTLTKKNPSMMHQYKSNNDMLTAQQMATRTAEHHPVEKSTNDTSNNNNINAHLPSLQSNQPRSKFLAGPLKAPTFVRTTARFDYQPDICKDYKETGFCGYGDTCIYLHDRGDTKSGWEMEREYEEKKRGEEERKRGEVEKFMRSMMTDDGTTNENDEEDENRFGKEETIEEDGIPFACHICRGPFRNPIVTSCQHYFCETCMSTRVKEVGTGCPICSKDTHGVLNFPQKLVGKKRRLIGRDGSWEEFFKKKNKKQR
eukprot:scaffold20338_cov47-Cyclotella_meneghiniana.AAC.4